MATTEIDIADDLLLAIENMADPVPADKLTKSPSIQGKVKLKEAVAILERLVSQGRLYQYERLGKTPRYSHLAPKVYAKKFLAEKLEAVRTLNDLKKMKSLVPILQECEINRVEVLLGEMIKDRLAYQLPPTPGSKTVKYSIHPPDPSDYIKAAAGRFRKQLETIEKQLQSFGVTKPDIEAAALRLLGIAPVPTPSLTTTTVSASQAVDLSQAIYDVFLELARERHSRTGLVPIHEVRSIIASKLSSQHARHDQFDPAAQKLRQNGRIRLISISDPRKASREELNDSIPGAYETLFYMRLPS